MTDHMTGTAVGVAGYSAGCRCTACAEEKRRWHVEYVKRRYLNRGPLLVSAEPTRIHLLWLRDNGMGCQQVAALTGQSGKHLYKITNGRTRRIHAYTERAVLAVGRQQASDGAKVDAGLTWRRLHSLMALGWPAPYLNHALGYADRSTLRLGRIQVTARNARAVIELCERLGATPGPSETTRAYAKGRGWKPYGSWDDDLRELTDHSSTEYRKAASG